MQNFDSICGNDAVKFSLRAALAHRFPQSILLTGPAASGKMALARVVAASLLCTGPDPRPCGACSSCHKISSNAHPDLDIVDEGDSDLPVALARTLRQQIHVMPNDGDRRVVILRHAHRLNTAAQNALLKVLEEPPSYAFFILTSEQPGAVLETIRSRCTRYHLEPPAQSTQIREELITLVAPFLRALTNADEYRMLKASVALEKLSKADFRAALDFIKTFLRDAIFSANALHGCILPDFSADAAHLAARVETNRLLELYDFISVLIGRTEINAAAAIQCAGLCAGAYQICFL